MIRARHRQKGLTLIEMMVALTIFATISAATVTVVQLVASADRDLNRVADQVADLERARAIIRNDLLQVTARSYREPDVLGATPPFLGGVTAQNRLPEVSGEEVLLAFVRRGWTNPGAAAPRASVQRVAYILRKDDIVRRARPFVDAARETPFQDQPLFTGVTDVQCEFLVAGQWTDGFAATDARSAPTAIRLQFEHPDYGPLTQLFLVQGESL